MHMANEQDVERRIRERAHQFWRDSGALEGSADTQWEPIREKVRPAFPAREHIPEEEQR